MATANDGSTKDPLEKQVNDYGVLAQYVEALRTLGNRIVVTIGSWDNLHIGHLRYLIKARRHGDVLIVGVDSDRGIKAYKGPLRPVIPEGERCEMLCYQVPVGYVTVIDDIDDNGNWGYELIKAIKPEVFVAVEDSYPEEQLADIRQYCNEVAVLPRQAETSTSKTIHDTVKSAMVMSVPHLASELTKQLSRLVSEAITPERISEILEGIEEKSRK